MHHGVPSGGPLVPELFATANRALRNTHTDAAVEVLLSKVVLRAENEGVVSVNGRLRTTIAGQRIEVAPDEDAVSYLSVPGGFDVPTVLGSRGTLLAARLGGHEGRTLRAGDVLRSRGEAPADAADTPAPPGDASARIRIVRGPDPFSPVALEKLLSSTFVLSPHGDRVGQRLDGVNLPGGSDRSGSRPMVRGAIQVTLDGTPIVLGPDHPTTGGYPVIGVVITSDQGDLARRRPGAAVRFALAL